MKKLILVLALCWGGGAAGWWYWNENHAQRIAFRTLRIERGNLVTTINATGTIEPEEWADVGSQVPGAVRTFGTDPKDPSRSISYGSRVDQGTVLAQLDDAIYKTRLDQAKANVAKAEADVQQAEVKVAQTERDLRRNERLQTKGPGMVAAQEHDTLLANFESAKAALIVSKSALEVAKANQEEAAVNLGYTTIRSPVQGVVIDRRVNIGQTVVANPNHSLFLIAKDLSRLQIWASVNETDLGSIHEGQGVRFTVSAFPGRSFRGKVAQIRMNASMVQSVVTYTVVVDVDNKDGKLLPYLTARLQFEVEERNSVLLAPNAALRWRPTPAHLAPEHQAEWARVQKLHASAERASSRTEGVLWVRHADGLHVRPVFVALGLNDGISTEVRDGELKDGSEIVVGLTRQESNETPTDDATSILPHTTVLEKKGKK
jgi:HlyD family secretion protein